MAKKKSRNITLTYRRIDELKQHPLNAEAFAPLDELMLEELADDIARRGQQTPIDISDDGTILGGHNRLEAMKRRGETWIRCRVIHGLDQIAAVEWLIKDNTVRRQLSPLQIARALQAEAKAVRDLNGKSPSDADLVDQVAKLINKSSRAARRYICLAQAPQAIQDAFERGALPLVMAEAVTRLPREQQMESAQRIAGGERAIDVARAALGRRSGATKPLTLPAPGLAAAVQAMCQIANKAADRLSSGQRLSPSTRAGLRRRAFSLAAAVSGESDETEIRPLIATDEEE